MVWAGPHFKDTHTLHETHFELFCGKEGVNPGNNCIAGTLGRRGNGGGLMQPCVFGGTLLPHTDTPGTQTYVLVPIKTDHE